MTSDKVLSIFMEYATNLRGAAEPTKFPSPDHVLQPEHKSQVRMAVSHLLYMSVEGMKLVHHLRMEKAMRWLGFVQGSLWALGLRSLSEVKTDNKPTDGEPDWVQVIKVEKHEARKNGELQHATLRIDGNSADMHALKPGWEFVVAYRMLDNKVVQTVRYFGSIDEKKNPFEER